ncbi:MAG: class II fructose-1,6-bisphosphate aldolase [Helicobacteraceae bacterium]|jgi:fructose-bisphosphate aldolase class II|nr:class II fructose-1,6-bisphosphate aldolase [Helicobacteraceae bacterium]
MLISGAKLLQKANEGGYAVGAFNINNMEMAQAIFEAANEASSPIIVQSSEGAMKYAGGEMLHAIVKTLSEKYPHIPVALNLDHGTSFESCLYAIKCGFTSVMIDASHHSFEENLAITKEVVRAAHAVDVGVEAELGRLSGIEDNIIVEGKNASLVDPDEAEKFVKESGVDYLAPAIGTSHGAFKFKGEPKLEFDLLKVVKKRVGIPLVLHGASSIPDEVRASFEGTGGDLKGSKGVPANFLTQAIAGGINKVNTDTDLRIAFMAEVRRVVKEKPSEIDPRNYFKPARAAVVKMLLERMKVLGSAGKI